MRSEAQVFIRQFQMVEQLSHIFPPPNKDLPNTGRQREVPDHLLTLKRSDAGGGSVPP